MCVFCLYLQFLALNRIFPLIIIIIIPVRGSRNKRPKELEIRNICTESHYYSRSRVEEQASKRA